MLPFFILLGEVILLFLFAKVLTKFLSHVLQLLHFHQKLIVFSIVIIFLPGTIVHELSHWLMAKLLFVSTGKISLFPKMQGSEIRLGSVEVAKVDGLRQLCIGFAPFISGIAILFISFSLVLPNVYSLNSWLLGLFIYLLFVITNSMFSSKKDVEGATFFLILLVVFSVILFVLDRHILENIQYVLLLIPDIYVKEAQLYLLISLLLDIAIITVLRLLINWLGR